VVSGDVLAIPSGLSGGLGLKRWILWNVRCRRGRDCADLIVTPEDTLPPGTALVVEYQCGGCGTSYRWNSRTFERTRVRRVTGDGFVIGPGESRHVEGWIPE
jgi:hypothetical protein